jgi:ParB-like chromosome segregation protein Spo0J
MEILGVNPSGVSVAAGRRPLNEARVCALMQSMGDIGLQHPITVWLAPGDIPHLIAGAHRLEAAKRLDWATIDVVISPMDEATRDLWEIDENLARAELSDDEKRECLKRRKAIWEKQQADRAVLVEASQGVTGKSLPTNSKPSKRGRIGEGRPPDIKGFAADTAEKTGLSKRRINQLLADPKPKKATTPEPSKQRKAPKTPVEQQQAAFNRRVELFDTYGESVLEDAAYLAEHVSEFSAEQTPAIRILAKRLISVLIKLDGGLSNDT